MAKVIQLETLPEVFLTEDITRDVAVRVVEQLASYRTQGAKKVALSIYSNGGDAKAGNFIAKWIANPANAIEVEARVYGNASSAAMIVATSCHSRYIADGSFSNVHFAYAVDNDGEVIEAKDQTPDVREGLAAINADQVSLFQRVTGKTKAQVESLMRQDRDITAERAVDFGFFDGLIPQTVRIAAYKQIPEKVEIKTRKVAVGHAKLLAAALTADGSIELPEESFTVTNAEEVTNLKADIEAKQKELDELKAKVDGIEAIEKAKTEAEAQVVALTKERDTFKAEAEEKTAQIEGIRKNPIVAQAVVDGTEKVVPGAIDTTPARVKDSKEIELEASAKAWEEAKKQYLN